MTSNIQTRRLTGWGIKRILPKEDGVVDVKKLDVKKMDCFIKFAAAKAFPSVVGILSRHLPYDMAYYPKARRAYGISKGEIKRRGELVFWGSGIIYESHRDDDDDETTLNYFTSIIICPAILFVRSNGLDPSDIQVDVCLWDGKVCQGRVIACDFHYNLAAIRIQTPCQLPTATLRNLDDVVPLNHTPIQQKQLQQQHRPPLRAHSTKFNISPETPLITISRSLRPLNAHSVGSGVFTTLGWNKELDYSELYWVKDNNHPEDKGGAVINYLGEVIGLMFYKSSFLPINLVSTWWRNFKSCRQYHRPCIGMKFVNLHATRTKSTNYLRKFLAVFPDVTGGVVVTKAAKDSAAYASGIRCNDVIVKCDGKLVRSSLELFEIVWNKVGIEYVELKVLRVSNGETLELSLKVEQTPPDKFYQWKKTSWNILKHQILLTLGHTAK
ncbi:putative protease Do-like 14 [Silene latifolia]|uniref:putative protease Do-like 14 n=1 Tax=Silene latifolia TaxID=37657 RepID=UPI003D781848